MKGLVCNCNCNCYCYCRTQENLDLVVAISLKRASRRPVLRSGSVVRKRDPVTGAEV